MRRAICSRKLFRATPSTAYENKSTNRNRTFHLLNKPDILTCYEHATKEGYKRGLSSRKGSGLFRLLKLTLSSGLSTMRSPWQSATRNPEF